MLLSVLSLDIKYVRRLRSSFWSLRKGWIGFVGSSRGGFFSKARSMGLTTSSTVEGVGVSWETASWAFTRALPHRSTARNPIPAIQHGSRNFNRRDRRDRRDFFFKIL